MRTKKLLSILLVLCMVIGCISPAVAIQTGDDAYNAASPVVQNEAEAQPEQTEDGETASGEPEEPVLHTLRDGHPVGGIVKGEDQLEIDSVSGAVSAAVGEGAWTITPVESAARLPVSQLPDSVAELKEAAEIYAAGDIVSAFVVMEASPAISLMGSANAEAEIRAQQNAVIKKIEKDVLGGDELQVDSQLAYLTNGFAITTEFGNLAGIARMDGVKSVFLMPVYYPCAVDSTVAVDNYLPYTESSAAMCGVTATWDTLGYTGEGMTIAIMDTGLDLDHPSFADRPSCPAWSSGDIADMMEQFDLNFELAYPGVTAEDVYYSAKVPFIFNYGSRSLDVTHADGIGDHGTHVAGIAAANAVEGTGVVGMAPDAQLVIMKVFNSSGGANMSDIVAALEDALKMGVDVVNMSLGSSAGFTSAANEWIDSVYASIAETEMIVNISAGNEGTSSYGNMWGTDLNPTDAIDNATVSSPSTYVNVNSIASVDNNSMMGSAIYVDGVAHMYNDGIFNADYSSTGDSGLKMTDVFYQSEELEYVMVPGLGYAEDFEGLDVEGKVAVVARGELAFSEKLANAEAAGAIALIVTNNVDGSITSFGMSLVDTDGGLPDGVSGTVPAILVSLATGEALAQCETKVITVAPEQVIVPDEGGGQVSSFSSWGPSPDLRLLPDIAGIGGNVYSCYDGGIYGYMSGTSMSAPQISGISALVMQYLKGRNMADSDLADALLMSTAVPAVSQTSGVEFSPRQQGAGLADVYSAIKSGAYITVDGGKPKAELGDDPARSGQFTFSFTIHNTTVFDTKTYNLSASLLTEDVDPTYASMGLFFMAGYDCPLDGTVTFDVGDSITVAPNSSETVTATVTLSDYGMAWLDYYYPNGGFVEGFVYLDCEKGIDMSLPYMGYYGDWTDPDVFDTAFWYDNSFWGLAPTDWYVDGNQYFHVVWTSLGGQDWVLGMNPYTGALADRNGNIIYDPANNVVSPNGDGVLDGFMDMYISLMRNAKELWFTYTDANTGEVYYGRDSFGGDNYAVNASKTMYFSGYQQVVPFIHSWYWYDCYDFTDAQGNYLPNGTELILTVSAKLDYEGAPEETIEIPVTVDTAAPELLGAQSVSQNGANYLLLTVSENVSLAYVALMSPNGTTVLADAYTFYENEDGTYTVVLDVTGFGNELMVALCDYGCNEGYYAVEYTGENTPEVDRSELFGYRVYDASIYDDSLYGWVTVDKETAELERVTNDMYEYYSLTAAEYVDGYIFAVDAGYNLIIVEPGTFFRTKTICNLGMNVYDMTWDEATNTMFLSGNATDEYGDTYYYFSTLDLLTGELTHITEGYSRSQVPWAMAATEDGTIYAIKCSDYYAYLYTVDKETGAMTAVTDAEGENLVLKRSNGSKASAYYTQSMTYSAEDGVIYWTFFNSSKAAELFTITPATEDTAVSYQSVKFPVNAEIVGLVSLDEDEDYSIPESDALSILVLDVEDMSLPVGAQAAITASCLPWNYELVNPVEWTSSDESVAVVDENGVVTALSKGTATITAECEGVSATCTVTVLAPAGTVYGYNYYSYGSEGDWFQLSVDDMTYTSLTASPVDFISADYNGHEGVIYGYDENGNFYRYDMFTGECETLGKSSILPFDMAYDYSTGFMYGFDGNGNLYRVNMGSGELSLIGGIVNEYGNSSYFIALACSTDGDLYAVDYMGDLYLIDPENIIPGYDWMTGAEVNYVMGSVVMSGLPQCQLLQSMCYEHNEGGIVWPCADYGTLVYIDPEVGGWVALGDYTGTNYVFEHVGMFSVPEDMPELSYVPVESVSAEDLAVFTGHSKAIPVSIMPLNATAQDLDWVSADTSVATVANGVVTGVSKGTTTLTGTLTDGENEFEVSVTVTVLEAADNVHAYLVSDLATYSGYCWIDIDVAQPSTGTSFIANNNYTMYSAEYVDGTGLVYGYGYDDTDWSANKQFMVFDAETYDLVSLTDMGDGFPFVYDMAYDYTTGTMYALASYNDSSSDLYMVNLDSGALIPAQTLERTYQSLVVDGEGTVLGISDGLMESDWWTGETTVISSYLVELDPTAGTETELFDLGMMSNMFASAAYDYDTGNIYWARFAQTTAYESGLCVIDVAGETCYDMGVINAAGAQVTGMHIICDEYPESPEGLMDVVMTSELELMGIGDTVELGVFIQPADCQVETEWYSSDPTVATVDENGVVTGVSSGVAYISVTVSDGTTTVTVTCKVVVFGEDDYLISYNRTDNGFSSIDRIDPTAVGNLTEGSSETDVSAMTQVDGVIYGYDENGNFFIIEDLETFQRETVGEHGVTLLESEEYICSFVVRDMAWDEANQRMLVLGCHWLEDEWGYGYEAVGGCRIYEADLTTGELTELVVLTSTYDYYSNAYTMTVDGEGTVYTYSTFIDYFGTVDMETGLVTETTTLQNQSLYGDSDGAPMAMAYDPVTETIYVVWTSNGSFYRLINFDPATGQAVLLGNIGEVIYDEDTWSNNGDLFAGLIIKEMHVHEYVEYTDNGDGTHTKSCECGNEVTEEHHDVEYTDNGDGTHTGSCICGAEFVEDHDYGYSDNGDGTHTGSCQCGSEFTEEHDYEDGQCVCGSEEPGNERPSRPIFPDVPGIIVPSDPTEPEQPEEPSEPEEPGETVELPFTDVDQDDWFYDEVSYAYENGLMNGVSDTLFAPGMDTTRGMIVTILYRLEGAPQVDGDSQFADVADGQWYTDAVIWAAANGIVTGYGDGNFGPLNTITREQLAAIMYRYASYKGYDVSASANLSVYTDADLISAYAVDAMSWANAVGLINGRTATTLVPQGLANRAESATILMRFCEMFAQ